MFNNKKGINEKYVVQKFKLNSPSISTFHHVYILFLLPLWRVYYYLQLCSRQYCAKMYHASLQDLYMMELITQPLLTGRRFPLRTGLAMLVSLQMSLHFEVRLHHKIQAEISHQDEVSINSACRLVLLQGRLCLITLA